MFTRHNERVIRFNLSIHDKLIMPETSFVSGSDSCTNMAAFQNFTEFKESGIKVFIFRKQ